ncbi:sensor histidine kinase [Dyadobacter sp. CY323]|uniref:sensor histidine kinase n=1 Tax=Dyadobacter sp. CY323 TaxID=2907302 RepID=UPI001F3DA75F|nr:histidine kinase [Dyadobacter sp. CY323]MCE6992520.1 histidine kinase [Dyadobacter sp. CY323]
MIRIIIILLILIAPCASGQTLVDSLKWDITNLKIQKKSLVRDSLLCEKYLALSKAYKWTEDWQPYKPDSALFYIDQSLPLAISDRQKAYCLFHKGDMYQIWNWGVKGNWIGSDYLSQSIRLFVKCRDREGIHIAANALYVDFASRYRGDTMFTENQLKVLILAMEAQTGENFVFPENFQSDTALIPVRAATYQKAIDACRRNLAHWQKIKNRPLMMWRGEVLGYLLYESGNHKKEALQLLLETRKIATELADNGTFLNITGHMAIWLEQKKDYRLSIQTAQEGYILSKRIGWTRKEAILGNILFRSYKALGIYDSAYFFKDRSIAILDSLSIVDAKKQVDLHNEKKIAEKQQAELQAKLLEEGQVRNYMLIAVALLFVSVIYVTWNNRKLTSKNREISQALLKGQTTERKRVAAELHDNLGSSLSAIRWNLIGLNRSKLEPTEQDIYDTVLDMVSTAHENVRSLSHNLLPEELEKEGLEVALKRLVSKLNQSKKTHFSYQNLAQPLRLEPRQTFELYNVILELSNNILKHSQASLAAIELEQNHEKLAVRVWDNGRGFDKQNEHGSGIQNIENRIFSLNGTCEISSGKDAGTKFEAIIPARSRT